MHTVIQKINEMKWEDACPSMQIAVQSKGEWVFEYSWGEVYQYFDLASLTKIFFTAPIFYELFGENKIEPDTNINQLLSEPISTGVELSKLLCHFSGFDWWNDYYKKIDIPDKIDFEQQWKKLWQLVQKEEIKPRENSIYSDIDFIVLGFVLQEQLQKNLHEIWSEFSNRYDIPFHMNKNNIAQYDSHLYAPTEICPWRNKTLQGEVHDDNTWSFGGVSSHAGLFGSLDDCKVMAERIRSNMSKKIFCDVAKFESYISRKIPAEVGDWSFGFMLPTSGRSSCGKYFSTKSIGHTGFTGTSYWFDPVKDLQIIILSNRVHPSRDNKAFVELRPKIHDTIVEELKLL